MNTFAVSLRLETDCFQENESQKGAVFKQWKIKQQGKRMSWTHWLYVSLHNDKTIGKITGECMRCGGKDRLLGQQAGWLSIKGTYCQDLGYEFNCWDLHDEEEN